MKAVDLQRHNEEALAVWEAYNASKPIRVPIILGTDTRFFIINNDLNLDETITFRDYSEDPLIMMDFQLRAAEWRGYHIAPYCDDQAGLPEKFTITVDMQRYFDAGFFGAKVKYRPGQIPDTQPFLTGDNKNLLFEKGLPNPLTGGIFAKALQFYDVMAGRIQKGLTYRERRVEFTPFGLETDGPLTVATNLRGIELYTDFYHNPDYVHQLLDFIVEGTIARIRAYRRFFGLPEISDTYGYADDSVQMISTEMVEEFVIPAHLKLKEALTTANRISLHLCGDATRHFKLFRDALGVYTFDTGFPVDFTWLRQELGPEVEIYGGPSIKLLLNGTPDQVAAETKRILQSGIMEGGRFVLREGNDLAPGTPTENLKVMYRTGCMFGQY